MTISIINLIKGGAAKSTIAANLAAQFYSDGEKVNLMDLDLIQGASAAWCEHNEISGFLNPSIDTMSELLEDGESVNIFDTGGYDMVTTQALISSSDVILLPTNMSSIELQAFIKLMQKIENIKTILGKDDMNLVVVPTRIHHAISNEAIAAYFEPLKELGYKIAPTIRYRISYQKTYENGGSVVGGADIKARTEIYNLSQYIKSLHDGTNL